MKNVAKINVKPLVYLTGLVALLLICQTASAADAEGWGGVAKNLTGSFEQLGRLITGGSYLAGLGFSIGAIMKFKQHKDNPSQTPVGTPIALVFIAASLLFLPSVLKSTGASMFGGDAETAGPAGGEIGKGGAFTPAK